MITCSVPLGIICTQCQSCNSPLTHSRMTSSQGLLSNDECVVEQVARLLELTLVSAKSCIWCH